MKTVDLIFPRKRMVCFFCHKSLMDEKDNYVDLHLCTSGGLAVLTCAEHAEEGDKMVTACNTFVAQFQTPAT